MFFPNTSYMRPLSSLPFSLSDASLEFGMESGLVIAVPIPVQRTEDEEISQAIDRAVLEAKLVF